MLSHDIRQPLNTILLAAGLLQNNEDKLTNVYPCAQVIQPKPNY